MRASYSDLPVTLSGPGFESRESTWGELVVARQSCTVELDTTDLMKGLPGGGCVCHHWGVVLKGQGVFRWPDREVVAGPGDAYYAEPGHVFLAAPDTELVEFTPKDEHDRVMAALADALP